MSCWEGSLAFGLVNWLNCVHWFIYFWLPAWNCTHSCIGLNQSLIFKKSWDRILWCTLYNRKRSEFPFIWKWWELVWHHKSNRWCLFAVSSFVSFKSTLTRKLQRKKFTSSLPTIFSSSFSIYGEFGAYHQQNSPWKCIWWKRFIFQLDVQLDLIQVENLLKIQ